MIKKTLLIIFSFISISILFFIGWNFKNKFEIQKSIYSSESNCKSTSCLEKNEGILISSPKRNDKIKNPLKITGQAKGFWFFEAEFIAELYDDNKTLLGKTILRAKDDWMTEGFVPFEGELIFSQPSTKLGVLRFINSNPSGLPEHQKTFEMPIKFEENYKKILLYYYNPKKDLDENGNIKCSENGLTAIERYISYSPTPIKDTLNLLLKGKENLSQEEINEGITTELPLEGLKIKSINLKPNGLLVLEFEDQLNKTSGGSCRVKILWTQIKATVKQFPEVKEVKFTPEYLFQP